MSRSEQVTFAAGSFWGVQAAFQPVARSTRAGYMGGHVDNPTPAQVAAGATGHAEVVEVSYDPDRATAFAELLLRFWQIHDATRRPRHGLPGLHPYRSVIFFHTAEQEKMARDWLASPEDWAARNFPRLIQERSPAPPAVHGGRPGQMRCSPTTEILPATTFWPAPPEEQNRLRLCDPLRLPDAHDVETLMTELDLAPVEGLDPAFASLAPAVLRAVSARSNTHLEAIVAALNRSLRTAPRAAAAPTGVTGSVPGAAALGYATAYVDMAAAQSQVTWAWQGTVHVFTTSFRPGNYLARHQSPAEDDGYETWIGSSASDLTWPSPGGSLGLVGGEVVTSPQALLSPPERRVPPARDPDPERMGAWHEHLADAELRVVVKPHDGGDPAPSQGETHLIRWHAGEVQLHAHPFETEHERALVALGADRWCCLNWYEIWRPEWIRQGWHDKSAIADLRSALVRLASPTSPVWLARPHLMAAATRQGQIPDTAQSRDSAWQPSPELRSHAGSILAVLRSMPTHLLQRWLLGALVALEDEDDAGRLGELDRVNLTALTLTPLCAAVTQTLWQWCRHDPSITYGHAVHRLLGRGEPPIAQGFVDGDTAHVLVGVPFDWLTRVWCRGLDVVDGHLILDVDGSAAATELDVLATRWADEGGPGTGRLQTRRTTIEWKDDRWHLTQP